MENKLVLIIVFGLIIAALYLALTAPQVEETVTVDTAARDLILKGLSKQIGVPEYNYSYKEISNDYELTYNVAKKGNLSLVQVTNPLSTKRVYFLENDTILCVDYERSVCSSTKNQAELDNYIESLRVKLLDDSRLEADKSNMAYMIANGIAKINYNTTQKPGCTQVEYQLDFSDITLEQAARFRISSNSPKLFNWTMCINNETGEIREKYFEYEYQGMINTYRYQLVKFSDPVQITVPENITTGAIVELRNEREQSVRIASCFADKTGSERNKCISDRALILQKPEICDLAGERRDQCLVSIIPKTNDEEICKIVLDPSFKEDCYIELAGKNKNESYCDMVSDKKDFCIEVANRNESNNNMPDINISDLLNCIEDGSCVE